MTKVDSTKKWRLLSVVGVFLLSVVLAPFSGVQFAHAAANTIVWSGAGDGTTFSDTGNWVGGSLPTTGDIIKFVPVALVDEESYGNSFTLHNDLDVALGGITLEGSDDESVAYSNYILDAVKFVGGASIVAPASGAFNSVATLNLWNAEVITQGDLFLGGSLDLLGDVTVGGQLSSGGRTGLGVDALVGSISATHLSYYEAHDTTTITTPMTFNGPDASLHFCGAFSMMGCLFDGAKTINVTSAITLNSDLEVYVPEGWTVNLTGSITKNGHAITLDTNSTGALNVGETAVVVEAKTTELKGENPSENVTVENKETAILSGSRGDVYVDSGGVLKGTGSMLHLTVTSGGVVAPGNSPGALTVRSSLLMAGGTYQAELLNKTAYDQLVVGSNYPGGGNAVTLVSAPTLSVSLFSGWKVARGDTFTIIDNRSNAAVNGTFAGLGEGAKFSVQGVTFSISYVGGDGNDVVLTALNSGTDPHAPNTGVMKFVHANPVAVIAMGAVAAAFIGLLARQRGSRRS